MNRSSRFGRSGLFALALSGTLTVLPPPSLWAAPAAKSDPSWMGDDLPLPLVVKTPQDLVLKAAAERQYLIFNLIARGKQAWDAGDFATAASRWEALLRLPGLDADVDRAVRPLAAQARAKAGGSAALAPNAPAAPPPAAPASEPPGDNRRRTVTMTGTVTGGGSLGPGGTVVWLKRSDGSTPRPSPVRGRTILQVNKAFSPRILAVTVGSKVDFRNQDDLYHNVFSLSRPNDFDAGLYKGGQSYSRTFSKPGPVQILCNIHASMISYVVVVDTPHYGQADAAGKFTIKGLSPGEYDLEAWNEGAARTTQQKVTVAVDGTRAVSIRLTGDRRPTASVPDKYGKPRQAQLGY